MKKILVLAFAATVLSAAPASAPLFTLRVTAPFACHTQGLTAAGNRLFVTCARRSDQRGLLLRYDLPENFPAAGITLQNPEVADLTRGSQWHPSGPDYDGSCVWMAVADYRQYGAHATVLCVNPDTLKISTEFAVDDHIGAVAAVGDEVWGLNWDARAIYRFGKDGKPAGRVKSPSPVGFQDCSGGPDSALCVGSDQKRKNAAVVERLTARGAEIQAARAATLETPGVKLGREGFAAISGQWAFLPDDLPDARLFIFPAQP